MASPHRGLTFRILQEGQCLKEDGMPEEDPHLSPNLISIISPFYNERENLRELCARLEKVAGALKESWEILFVDDGSTDGGGELLRSLLSRAKPIRLIRLEPNQGLTAALHAGLKEARGEILVTLDSDLQNPPEEIPRLLNLLEGADIVAGIRRERKDSWLKRVSSKIANVIRRSVTGDHIEDTGCSLRAFRREALRAFLPSKGMHRFFLPLAETEGFKIKQVGVQHEPRRSGKSKYGLHNRLIGPLRDLMKVHRMLKEKRHF